MPPINISIDSHGAIKCEPKGGHFHGKPGDTIDWVGKGNVTFTLIFRNFDTDQEAPWPFSQPPTKPTNWPLPSFSGTIANKGLPFYKYVVQVKGCDDLDPIIIVDR